MGPPAPSQAGCFTHLPPRVSTPPPHSLQGQRSSPWQFPPAWVDVGSSPRRPQDGQRRVMALLAPPSILPPDHLWAATTPLVSVPSPASILSPHHLHLARSPPPTHAIPITTVPDLQGLIMHAWPFQIQPPWIFLRGSLLALHLPRTCPIQTPWLLNPGPTTTKHHLQPTVHSFHWLQLQPNSLSPQELV